MGKEVMQSDKELVAVQAELELDLVPATPESMQPVSAAPACRALVQCLSGLRKVSSQHPHSARNLFPGQWCARANLVLRRPVWH